MQYFEVLVADQSFKGANALTYHYFEQLPVGQIVSVPIKNKQVFGVISRQVTKPKFPTKPLSPAEHTAPLPEQLIGLATWITKYYPAGIGVTLQQFLPQKVYKNEEIELPEARQTAADLPELKAEQRQAVETMSQPGTYILHGETGSGKTRVYVELVKHANTLLPRASPASS
jgi:primosomal protein N' (replication factor Y) (superfamily II helicase)